MKDAILAAVGIAVVVVLATSVYQNYRRFHKPQLTTPYQTVMLANGSAFYGRIDHLGTDYPVLRDAFTIHREFDSATQQSRYFVVKRKAEINGADHMIFPASAIAFIEPVQPDSTVGKLIAQARSQN